MVPLKLVVLILTLVLGHEAQIFYQAPGPDPTLGPDPVPPTPITPDPVPPLLGADECRRANHFCLGVNKDVPTPWRFAYEGSDDKLGEPDSCLKTNGQDECHVKIRGFISNSANDGPRTLIGIQIPEAAPVRNVTFYFWRASKEKVHLELGNHAYKLKDNSVQGMQEIPDHPWFKWQKEKLQNSSGSNKYLFSSAPSNSKDTIVAWSGQIRVFISNDNLLDAKNNFISYDVSKALVINRLNIAWDSGSPQTYDTVPIIVSKAKVKEAETQDLFGADVQLPAKDQNWPSAFDPPAPSATPARPPPEKSKKGLKIGIILLIVAALLGLLALVICLCIHCNKKKKEPAPSTSSEPLAKPSPPPQVVETKPKAVVVSKPMPVERPVRGRSQLLL